jgi:hypothetical protein
MIMPLFWRTQMMSFKLSCMRVWGILVGFLHISLGRLEGTYMYMWLQLVLGRRGMRSKMFVL